MLRGVIGELSELIAIRYKRSHGRMNGKKKQSVEVASLKLIIVLPTMRYIYKLGIHYYVNNLLT